ncbi:hypothetical protein [Xanthomonas sp. BRIP62409]|uniref:hypothetical protein n=1 Tax=Xanthomonas sp. BRIP62409 TaxID=2182388 RepID=UPI000F8E65CE|nr:hypothetical protein [Xanthomonas sp. BRIP62409]
MSKRNLIEEIISKQSRLHRRGTRVDLFRRRVHPLVKGFRAILAAPAETTYRAEWLKYGAIGYIACVEGYFRLLIAAIIDTGEPYVSRITNLKDIRFTPESVVAIHKKQVSLGNFIAHLLPVNGVSDINSHLSALLDIDYLKHYLAQPLSKWNQDPIGQVFDKDMAHLERLFKLRHLYAHELATKERVPIREMENLIGAAAAFVTLTERTIVEGWQIDA